MPSPGERFTVWRCPECGVTDLYHVAGKHRTSCLATQSLERIEVVPAAEVEGLRETRDKQDEAMLALHEVASRYGDALRQIKADAEQMKGLGMREEAAEAFELIERTASEALAAFLSESENR